MLRLFCINLLITLFLGTILTMPLQASDEDVYKGLSTLTRVLDLIERNYVEDVEPQKLTTGAIEGMLRTLDPYSAYLTPERYREFEEGTSGEFGGVGIEISVKDDMLTVVAPLDDSPAQKAGIKPGDRITKINGLSTQGMSIHDAVRALRGPSGTTVTVTIKSAKDGSLRDFTLTRELIKTSSVKHELMEGGFGYVRITSFQEKTSEELAKALGDLKSRGGGKIEGLVLDLRNNPGGLLGEAVEVADKFIDDGLIVSVRGRTKDQTIEYWASKEDPPSTYPIVVLVNGGSASASEVVAEALQDQGRAVILGTKTFGKGSVQTIIKLEDGSGLKLTTARFYAPSGRSINEVGVVPDIIVTETSDEDLQLKRALELLRGRSVEFMKKEGAH
jgi:carboxyl-terminal processing protease